MNSISPKQYELIIPQQTASTDISFESTIENAILLALLEKQYITHWQYEQCCTKLGCPTADTDDLKL